MSETTKRYPIYVLGIEKMRRFYCCSRFEIPKAYKIDWPFNKVYRDNR